MRRLCQTMKTDDEALDPAEPAKTSNKRTCPFCKAKVFKAKIHVLGSFMSPQPAAAGNVWFPAP